MTTSPTILALPEPTYPMVAQVLTSPIDNSNELVRWVVAQAHPLIPNMRILRMFITETSIEIYSMTSPGVQPATVRNVVPLTHVRLIEEFMPPEIFIEELAHAEAANSGAGDDDDDDSGEGDDEEPRDTQNGNVVSLPTNNQS